MRVSVGGENVFPPPEGSIDGFASCQANACMYLNSLMDADNVCLHTYRAELLCTMCVFRLANECHQDPVVLLLLYLAQKVSREAQCRAKRVFFNNRIPKT